MTKLTLNLYEKRYKDLPQASEDPTNFVMDSGIDYGFIRPFGPLLDRGQAYARGMEFLIKKNVIQDLYGLLSISVFRSRLYRLVQITSALKASLVGKLVPAGRQERSKSKEQPGA